VILQIEIFYWFFRAWINQLTAKTPVKSRHYAEKNLFGGSFRVPQSEHESILLVPKFFLKTFMGVIVKRNKGSVCISTSKLNKNCIYDVSLNGFKDRADYVKHFSGNELGGGVFKEHLASHLTLLSSFVLTVLNTVWYPVLWLHSLFIKNKSSLALLYREQLELTALLKIMNHHGFKHVYYFSIYEKDSNIAACLLMKYGIRVSKIPSEVPLSYWNRIIVADDLFLCSGYQLDELKYFGSSVFVKHFDLWGPEKCLMNLSKYSKPVEIKKNTIGFYSTGAWVRKLEDHSEQGFDMVAAEESVKDALLSFCLLRQDVELHVFLHPREKWEKYYEEAKKIYHEKFGNIRYKLSEKSDISSLDFERAELGVAFQSTIVYERLYYGFKTLVMPIGTNVFPLKNSPMMNICSFSKDELYTKLNESLGLSSKEFFVKNKIKHYTTFTLN
jgi:hypothetical protein